VSAVTILSGTPYCGITALMTPEASFTIAIFCNYRSQISSCQLKFVHGQTPLPTFNRRQKSFITFDSVFPLELKSAKPSRFQRLINFLALTLEGEGA
jgi:hypothetical protein